MENDLLVWVDLETTGLEPQIIGGARILEMAVVVTTPGLSIQYSNDWLFDLPTDMTVMDDVVTEMHTNSGLLEACAKGPTWRWKEATAEFLSDMAEFAEPRSIPLAGSSCHFDRAWLKVFAPEIEAWFHYRHADVSSLHAFAERWIPEVAVNCPPSGEVHRATADIMASIDKARFYRNFNLSKRPRNPGW